MDHTLRCKCGTLQGTVAHTDRANRGVCYCRDCQAYAHALGGAETILDKLGGSDVVAVLQENVGFSQGTEALACMSLSERGLLRWYASCCNTPIGNTQRGPKISFVGLLHNCLEHSDRSIDEAFGPVRMRVGMKHAKGKVAGMPLSTFTSVAGFLVSMVKARISGGYKRTPFFSADSLQPVAVPKVLSKSERERAYGAV